MTNEEINIGIVVLTGGHWHETGDWYCPECKSYLDSSRVTYQEQCDECGSLVLIGCKHCDRKFSTTDIYHNPDYCSSFDLIIPLIQDLRENKKIWANVFDEIFIDYDSDSVASLAIWIGDLTPLQLSEAVYKALKENEKK